MCKPGAIALQVALLLLLGAPAQAEQASSLLGFELRSLAEPERHSLARYQGTPLLMMFFEPKCGWCERQFKVLDKLQADCRGAVRPLAVGVNGSRRDLLAESRRIKPKIPVYQASQSLLKTVGDVPATPFTLVLDAQGQAMGWLRGYMSEEKLRPILQQQFGAC